MPLWDNDITTDNRPYVMELQSYLRAIQRAQYGTTTVPMDGFYGADTVAGVRQFQQNAEMPVTGVVNRATWDAIYAVYRDTQRQQTPPLTIRGLRRPLLQPGVTDDAVVFLNVMLGIVGTEYTTDTDIPNLCLHANRNGAVSVPIGMDIGNSHIIAAATEGNTFPAPGIDIPNG